MKARRKLTRRKLEEAEFFLTQLRPNYNKDRKFDFYLSAFVSAARSVPWAMQAEYATRPGWREWYDAKKPDSEELRLFKGTTTVRNRSQKAGALRTLSHVKVAGLVMPNGDEMLPKEILARAMREGIPAKIGGVSGKYTVEYVIDGQLIMLLAKKVIFERQLQEFPGEDILDVCDRYYKAISALVAQCEARFDA